jgi:hypothetical protein
VKWLCSLTAIAIVLALSGCHGSGASQATGTTLAFARPSRDAATSKPKPPPSIKQSLPPASLDHRNGSPVLGYLKYVKFIRHGGNPRPSIDSGWGDYKPVSIGYEGDGTSDFSRVSWSGWGQPRAYGHGVSLIFHPHGGHVEVRGELRASRLGTCHGRLAYEHVDYRLFYVRGTDLYRSYGVTSGRWFPYGFSDDHGNICRASKVLP